MTAETATNHATLFLSYKHENNQVCINILSALEGFLVLEL